MIVDVNHSLSVIPAQAGIWCSIKLSFLKVINPLFQARNSWIRRNDAIMTC